MKIILLKPSIIHLVSKNPGSTEIASRRAFRLFVPEEQTMFIWWDEVIFCKHCERIIVPNETILASTELEGNEEMDYLELIRMFKALHGKLHLATQNLEAAMLFQLKT